MEFSLKLLILDLILGSDAYKQWRIKNYFLINIYISHWNTVLMLEVRDFKTENNSLYISEQKMLS